MRFKNNQITHEEKARILAENNSRILALEDTFESLYDVDLETARYDVLIKGQTFGDINTRLTNNNEFFEDTKKNIENILHPDDKEGVLKLLEPNNLRKMLKKQSHIDWYYRMIANGVPFWARMRILYKDERKRNIIIGVFNAEEEMAAKRLIEKEKAKNQDIIRGFANKYEAAFLGNLYDGSYRVVANKDKILDNIPQFSTFSEITQFYADTFVYPADRAKYKEILCSPEGARARLKIGETVRFEYRSNTTGVYLWYRANIVRISELEALVGYEQCNEEVVSKLVRDKLTDEYDALYILDIDRNEIHPARPSRVTPTGVFYDKIPYDKVALKFSEEVAPDYRQDWAKFSDVNYVREYLSAEDHREYVYELPGTKVTMRRVTFDVIERFDGEAKSVLMSFIGIDDLRAQAIKLQKRMAEQSALLDYFVGAYDSAYYVNLADESFEIIHMKHEYAHLFGAFGNDRNAMETFIRRYVHPDDQAMMFQMIDKYYIIGRMRHEPSINFTVREIYDDKVKYLRVVIIRVSDEEHLAVGFMDITEELLHEQEERRKAQAAQTLIDSFTLKYNLVYRVNLTRDTFITLRKDEHMAGNDKDFQSFSDVIDFFLSDVVFSVDRPMMERELNLKHMAERIAAEPSYSIQYRAFLGGMTIWNEMVVNTLDPDHIVVGFVTDNNEILLDNLQSMESEDYYAIYSIDLDTETLSVLRRAPEIGKLQEGVCYPASQALLDYADLIGGKEGDFFRVLSDMDKLRGRFATEDKSTFSFQSPFFEDGLWRSLTSFVLNRHEDGTPAVISLGFSIMDTFGSDRQALMSRIAEQSAFTQYFLEPYVSAYYVGMDDLSLQIYKRTDQLEQDYPIVTNYVESLMEYIDKEVYPDDRSGLSVLIQPDNMKRILSSQPEFSYTYRTLQGDELRHMRFQVIRGADESHAAFGFRDITEEIKAEHEQQKQLQDALSMAQSANRAKTTFLNNMSHDIRTPMNAIIGYTGLAASHIDDKAQVQDYLSKIGQSSSHLLSLINDVLDMSRIESGKMHLDEKAENILEIVHTLRDIIMANVHTKQLDFKVENVDVSHELVMCDKLRLNQVLLNILSNAIKYTPAGGQISLSVSEKASTESGCGTYEFVVRDNGVGMSQDFLKTIFDPFTRARSSTVSGIQGTGLGMAITKNIIDMMGGKIDIKSEPSCGTEVIMEFVFKLRSEQEGTDASDGAGDAAAAQKVFDLSGKRILLVEDNELNREIATAILEEFGCKIATAEDGDIAVARMAEAQEGDYDLVLMDVQMPTIDGYEATRRIRAMGTPISRIPILAMTANAFEEDRMAALEAGMDDHIAKPIDIDALKETLARHLF